MMLKQRRKAAMEILEVLVAVLMIVAIFALVVMMNMRFKSVIDTSIPFRMAVLVANRLSGSPDLVATPAAGESAHKNLLSAAKLDDYANNYKETMPQGTALLCFHWRASVREPDTYGYWEFGQNPLSDMSPQFTSAITGLSSTAYKSISENPINVFQFAFPPGFLTQTLMTEMIDMAPSTYSLPVSVATDSTASSCVSAGGRCEAWTGYYCGGDETDVGVKDCSSFLGIPYHCCVKSDFAYAGSVGATLPAMLEVSVWKSNPECRDANVIQKILGEIQASATA